jgi:hypothetical protein
VGLSLKIRGFPRLAGELPAITIHRLKIVTPEPRSFGHVLLGNSKDQIKTNAVEEKERRMF